jgi:TRAP-type C4-dicarboxylate transport system permease small subunit
MEEIASMSFNYNNLLGYFVIPLIAGGVIVFFIILQNLIYLFEEIKKEHKEEKQREELDKNKENKNE